MVTPIAVCRVTWIDPLLRTSERARAGQQVNPGADRVYFSRLSA